MKPRWIMVLVCVVSLGFGDTNQPPTMRGAQPRKVKSPATTIIVGANAVAGGVAEPGWPVIVSAAGEDDTPLPSNLGVKITDDSNQEVPMTFERIRDVWVAGENATTALKPGRYRVTLVPAGDRRIESGDLLVESANPARAAALGLLKIQRALLAGRDDEALAEADRHPQSPDIWIAKGDILMANDRPDEALAAFEKARELHDPKDGENLPLMVRLRDAYLRSLEKRGVIPPSPGK